MVFMYSHPSTSCALISGVAQIHPITITTEQINFLPIKVKIDNKEGLLIL